VAPTLPRGTTAQRFCPTFIMPNHELCRADLTPPKRRARIDEPTRHNQGDFSKGDQSFIRDKERAMAVR